MKKSDINNFKKILRDDVKILNKKTCIGSKKMLIDGIEYDGIEYVSGKNIYNLFYKKSFYVTKDKVNELLYMATFKDGVKVINKNQINYDANKKTVINILDKYEVDNNDIDKYNNVKSKHFNLSSYLFPHEELNTIYINSIKLYFLEKNIGSEYIDKLKQIINFKDFICSNSFTERG